MNHRSGPVVWIGIIASTCLLLFLFKKILWLVVPFLLALIIYYFLQPATQRLVLHGFHRKTAAAITGGGFHGASRCRFGDFAPTPAQGNQQQPD